MARYIDIEGYRKLFDEEYKKTRTLISEGETHLDNLAEGFSEASRVIDRIPTADVVPKSEVDLYRKQVDELEDELASTYDKLENAKAEVAREIFEEIKEIGSFGEPIVDYICMSFDELAELKKKYTEG